MGNTSKNAPFFSGIFSGIFERLLDCHPQISPDEIYLYACECNEGMLPAVSWNGALQCYRMNGTDQCGGDNCWTDTWHLKWNAKHAPPCLGLCNGTDCNSS